MPSLPFLHSTQTAKVLRKILRAAFPATTFRVRTNRGANVSSVTVSWTDGPTVRRVDAIAWRFQAGRFNGMIDMYEDDRTRFIEVDGVMYRPGCDYVHTSRTVSPALANRCIQQIVSYWGGIEEQPRAVPSKYNDGYALEPECGHRHIRPDVDLDWYTAIHRAAADRTNYRRENVEAR